MSISLTASKAFFVGTGAAATYGTGIYATDSAQMRVYVNGVLQPTLVGYTLANLGYSGGVDVNGTFNNGDIIKVERVTPITQLVDTQNNETILEDVIDAALDKLTEIAQELDRRSSDNFARSLRVPDGETVIELPAAATRIVKPRLKFDNTGQPMLQTNLELVTDLLPNITALLPEGLRGAPGADATNVGLFVAIPSIVIPANINKISVTGYSAVGDAGSELEYVYDATVTAATVAAAVDPLSYTVSANNRGFHRIGVSRMVWPASAVQDANFVTSVYERARLSTLMNASIVNGGTAGFPQHIGMKHYFERKVGDGVTSVFTFTAPFILLNTSYQNFMISRTSDNQYSIPPISSITGWGTNTITVTLTGPLTLTQNLDCDLIGEQDPTANPRLIGCMDGYDNLVQQLMCTVSGAHMRMSGAGNHNTALGGSTCLLLGGSYGIIGGYHSIGGRLNPGSTGMVILGQNLEGDGRGVFIVGQGNKANGNGAFVGGETNSVLASGGVAIGNANSVTASNGVALGSTHTVSGTYAFAAGLTNIVSASYSGAIGRLHNVSGGTSFAAGQGHVISHSTCFAFGFSGISRNVFERIMSFAPTLAGDFQAVDSGMKGTTTDATLVTLTKTGGSAFLLGTDSVDAVTIEFVGREVATGDVVVLDLKATVKVSAAGAAAVVGGGAAVIRHSDAGLSTCAASITASGSGLAIKVQGVAAKTIKWAAFIRANEFGAGA